VLGILIRDAEALERLEKIDTLAIDKTGTLTEGKPRLIGILAGRLDLQNGDLPENDPPEGVQSQSQDVQAGDELLRLAASLELASEHPLAGAIVEAAKQRNLKLSQPSNFVSTPGKGISGTVDRKRVAVGNMALMNELNAFERARAGISTNAKRPSNMLFVAVDETYAGGLIVTDPIKRSTPEAVRDLKRLGLHVVMLTGDSRATAEQIAKDLNIDEFEAEVLPERKSEVVKELQRQGRVVAMAGDGVNDAPALAQADVGIAMGTGTDVAMESGGITLVKGDLTGILRARKLSQATMRNIRQNLFFAFIYNAVGVPIAAGVLYPIFGWLLSPIFAAAAMSFSSVSVITNALRLRHVKL
jgi:heavy metal translocating P-type ATPase